MAKISCIVLMVLGCVEPYEFDIPVQDRHIVIDSYLSDRSFTETLAYPSDGRYFTVTLSYTSKVSNVRNENVTGATVGLRDNDGGEWLYTETEPGIYKLIDNDFKAVPGIEYQQWVTVDDGTSYESVWAGLPEHDKAIGAVGFTETEKLLYRYEAQEAIVREVQGINGVVELPPNETGDPIYYRWDVEPMWVFLAPEQTSASPVKKCWITDSLYLNDYALAADQKGGYPQPVFFMETVRNDRIYNQFSALVIQQILSEDYYFFLKELKEQAQGGLLVDTPPYTLRTNYYSVGSDKPVSGYFGVVRESARRWYFRRSDLSYYVEDTALADCNIPYLDPSPQCFNCLEYAYGKAVNTKPSWWEE